MKKKEHLMYRKVFHKFSKSSMKNPEGFAGSCGRVKFFLRERGRGRVVENNFSKK